MKAEFSGAIFDRSGRYRYRLWRKWSDGPGLVFVMLNPSTADAEANDPTITRCLRFAQSWKFGRLEVVNLFAYRATESKVLPKVKDPFGPKNDEHIRDSATRGDTIIIAWGNHGRLHGADRRALEILSQHKLFCLGVTKSGQPRHPLYLSKELFPVPYLCPFDTSCSARERSVSESLIG